MSTETSPLRRDLYAVRLDGKDKKRLTGGNGTYNILPSEGFRYYISYFSNVETPERITLHAADGRLIRTLEDNAALRDTLAERGVPVKEFFTFRNSEGIELNGYLLRPGDFDPAKKYPVLMTQYSGPGSQQVADRWTMDWTDVLAQQGYIVACVDGRGTGSAANRSANARTGNWDATKPKTRSKRPATWGRCLTWTGRGSAFTAGVTAGSWR